ncbi:MAG: hypothetical protein IT370_11395 [Deltaproteobacteria bacterium]|nr:hypothetical protein [Deltaproteobacteria bacterium]
MSRPTVIAAVLGVVLGAGAVLGLQALRGGPSARARASAPAAAQGAVPPAEAAAPGPAAATLAAPTAQAPAPAATAGAPAAPNARPGSAAAAVAPALLLPPPASASLAELRAREQAQREALVALTRALSAPRVRDVGDVFDQTPEELAAMAADCALRYDVPPFGSEPALLSDAEVAKLGLSFAERESHDRLLTALNRSVRDDVRALYVELTGDRAGADDLDLWALRQELVAKALPADRIEAQRRIAAERAGLATPPTPAQLASRPVYERFLRRLIASADELERALAGEVGPASANALRRARGSRFALSGCEDGVAASTR